MVEQKNAFIFDLEGVLIDHTKRQCEVATKALASVGIGVNIRPETYQLRSEDAFHITRDFLSGLYLMQKEKVPLEIAKANPHLIEQKRESLTQKEWALIDKAVKNFDALRTHGELVVGRKRLVIRAKEPALQKIRQMLHWGKIKGHPMIMVTAGKKVDATAFMREAGLLKYFKGDHLFFGEDKVKKGGMFGIAAEMLQSQYGIRKGRQWVVEDSLSGIKAAKANGLRSAMVLTGNTSLERIQRLPPGQRPTLVLQHAKDLLGTLVPTKSGQIARRKARKVRQKAIRTKKSTRRRSR
jgi:beta-phosphoglucomutase-like phosphatase (HAD superfamily)